MPTTTINNTSSLDRLLSEADHALRVIAGKQPASARFPAPAANTTEPGSQFSEEQLSDEQRKRSAGLMRVNHSGEVCAQALYRGQALTAKLEHTRAEMDAAAEEELEHLSWCEQRLDDLDSHTSALNPLWYAASFGLGAAAGLVSDRLSLGFVAATEDQVCRHLSEHLAQLPEHDVESRAVVEQMLADEAQHADRARTAGAMEFPAPLKSAMTAVSGLMTRSSYFI
ncbi:MAG: 2-polyprenyl-3-methyl-6-methoxy-1,4-benzoquinone monooxygenase [Porticoccaceae bacterium]|nr:2-polyprenyl-3-methyl-6-methoxy-1,4-benzoquinone monooxygenase [Porticoccaceae bacterium]